MQEKNQENTLPRTAGMCFNKETTLKYATYYALRGWRVLPLTPAFKGQNTSGKLPSSRGSKFILDGTSERIPMKDKYGKTITNQYGKIQYAFEYGGCKNATTDLALLEQRFCDESYAPETKCDRLNIGIATGIDSDIVVVDLDGKESLEQLELLEAKYGKLPDTLRSVTGRDCGEHRLYRPPKDKNGNPVPVRSKSKYVAPDIDIKGDGGYIVVEPSMHWTGNRYHFDQDPDNTEIAELPMWIVDLLNGVNWSQQEECLFPEEKKTLQQKNNDKKQGKSKNTQQYRFRHDNTATQNFYICRDGEDEIEVIECDWCSNHYYGRCPWHPNSVSGHSLCIYDLEDRFYCFGCNEKGVAMSQDEVDELDNKSDDHIKELLVEHWKSRQRKYSLTDAGNAERFADTFGDQIKYNWDNKRWMAYDGIRWNVEQGEAIAHNFAVQIARDIHKEALKISDHDIKKRHIAWALKSESAYGIINMLKLARALPTIRTYSDNLNKDIYLLNCNNGTVNLKTGLLQPHNPSDMITELVPVDYIKDAQCQLWLDCLDTWMKSDQEVINFLQKLMGMCLTGDITSRIFTIFYGEGMNGKSIFVDTISEIMGCYADVAPENFLIETRNDKKNEIAELKDKRLVVASETDKHVKLSSKLVKSITGDRRIKGRLLYQQSVTFDITYKCILVTNHLPEVEDDKAIWDRIRKIEWNVRIPPEKRDPYLLDKLRAEHAGILQWLIQGCIQWFKEGKLIAPQAVVDATNQYKEQSNPLKDFFEECCIISPEAKIKTSDLYKAYSEWIGKCSVTKREFNEYIRENGYREGRTTKNGKTIRYWTGITITESFSSSCSFFFEDLNLPEKNK
ncbi:MAG: bifunctional DNA primase/polymerase [Tissierellales bacterium]|nr:bifunctional DNA primase/polymerase [Tissierellales bacterium]